MLGRRVGSRGSHSALREGSAHGQGASKHVQGRHKTPVFSLQLLDHKASSGCPAWDRELGSMILLGPFQLKVFYGSVS